ncbi:DUF7278 family profilin-like fold-containing protein [Enterococcus nangangensis]|uniref:DUF7278 family profilin-like fold-containing protein n=1 Tax=Enterococcus nangangensis TaxID=2559926 RepID=UPI0010F68666|nr:hypothetical protein [Enterococcus nangangensis]
MNAFEQMYWPIWKTLQDKDKMVLMRQVLMYFVSPLTLVRDVELRDFEMGGVKCRTFTFTINGEPFVFVPGQKEAILGWDQGTEGLSLRDILASEAAFNFFEQHTHPQIPTPEELAAVVNENTSALRKVNVPPMIVSRYAIPFGCSYIGDFDTITGLFYGEVADFSPIETAIRQIVYPAMTQEESLTWEFPKRFFKEGAFYLELDPRDSRYHVYKHQVKTLATVEKELRRYNFYFPTEDEYEYLIGGGTRRLFVWGSSLNFFDGVNITPSFSQIDNMFGLKINIDRWQHSLLRDTDVVKAGPVDSTSPNLMAALLPLSHYYRRVDPLLPEASLPAQDYAYRKVTRILP